MADLGGVVFDDYSADVLDAMHDAVVQALERCGEQAEGYAKDLTPVDTGNLRNSITHQVDDGVKCSPKVGQKLCGKAILNSVLDRT